MKDGKVKTMGNAFYDGDREAQNLKQRKYLTARRDRDLFLYRSILTGTHVHRTCPHLDPSSSEKCACTPLISKIILDNLMRSKRRLAEMYAFDELGNYNYCCNALMNCGINNNILRQVRERVRLNARRNAPDGYRRVFSIELVRKYNLYHCIVEDYPEMSTSYLLKIPDPFTHSQ